ncbi:MAG: TetR/AcrR family transcriptional regulator [Marinobacterium sp.]|nr:TetR/AcrR family transcriptional regulator [Marinobacterium sp.]
MAPNGNALLTRAQILEAAVDIIAENGLTALTAANLIKHAGISKGGLYHHFKQMDDVTLAALEVMVDRFIDLLDDATDDNLPDFLIRVESNLFDVQLQNRRLTRALYTFFEQVMFKPIYRHSISRLFATIRGLRRRQIMAARPDLEQQQVDRLLCLLETFTFGLLMRHHVDEKEMVTSEREHWTQFTEMLLSTVPAVSEAAVVQSTGDESAVISSAMACQA